MPQSPVGWFTTGLGNVFRAAAASEISRVLPEVYFGVVLDLGPGIIDYPQTLDAGLVLRVNPPDQSSLSPVIAKWENLPLGRNSVDLIVLQHTLDFSIDPRRVLREAIEVLSAEGWIVICGFNPVSLWGLWRLFCKSGDTQLWQARFLRLGRIQDWLSLLGTHITGGRMFFYRPPLQTVRLLTKMEPLERAGARWWPALSGAYLIAAQKREISARIGPGRFAIRERAGTQGI